MAIHNCQACIGAQIFMLFYVTALMANYKQTVFTWIGHSIFTWEFFLTKLEAFLICLASESSNMICISIYNHIKTSAIFYRYNE